MEKLWAENAFDFVYSPVDLTFILSHRKNLEELGIVAMEAIQSTADKSLADAEFKRLEKLIKNTKVHLKIIIPNSTFFTKFYFSVEWATGWVQLLN